MKWEKTFLYSRGYEDHYKITCPNCGYNEEVIMVEGKIEGEVVCCKKCGKNMKGEDEEKGERVSEEETQGYCGV